MSEVVGAFAVVVVVLLVIGVGVAAAVRAGAGLAVVACTIVIGGAWTLGLDVDEVTGASAGLWRSAVELEVSGAGELFVCPNETKIAAKNAVVPQASR